MPPKLLKAAFAHHIPDVLYHYTDQRGLLGIIDNRKIWLTHTQYLNDAKEFKVALELLRDRFIEQYIAARAAENGDGRRAKAINIMHQATKGIEGQCICVFSLSERSDSLSQWRAYGGSKAGFAIGFNRDTLQKLCHRRSLTLGKCIYNESEHDLLISELVEKAIEQALAYEETSDDPQWTEKVGECITRLVRMYGPLLKDASFEEEQEWRIITGPISTVAADLNFREGSSSIIPYFEANLDESADNKFCAERIIVGPTPHAEDACHAIRIMLARHHMAKCALTGVSPSAVPYRSW